MDSIPRSVPATAVGAAGVVGSGVTAFGLLSSIAGKLSGDDWISVVVLGITAIVILFGLATLAVGAGFMLFQGFGIESGSSRPHRPGIDGADGPTLILMTGLALVVAGLVIIAIVALAN